MALQEKYLELEFKISDILLELQELGNLLDNCTEDISVGSPQACKLHEAMGYVQNAMQSIKEMDVSACDKTLKHA